MSSESKVLKWDESQKPKNEFTGNMRDGMNFYFLLTMLQVVTSNIFLNIAQEEIIFTDRLAPMFAFTAIKAMISLSFTAFWIMCSSPST